MTDDTALDEPLERMEIEAIRSRLELGYTLNKRQREGLFALLDAALAPARPAGLREVEDAMLAIANLPLTKERGDHLLTVIRAALDAAPARPSGLLREAAMDALDWWAGQIVKDKADPTGDALFSALRAALAATPANPPGLREAAQEMADTYDGLMGSLHSPLMDRSCQRLRAALLAAPLDVEESDVWLLPATAKGTAIGTDEWLRPLYVIRNLSSPDEMRPYGALAARLRENTEADGELWAALDELLSDYLDEHGPDGYPRPMPMAWRVVAARLRENTKRVVAARLRENTDKADHE